MRIALALGSGGARGYTHIGVLDELHARGHTIAAISGTSMGALVGGLEAAGKLADYVEWVTTLQRGDVLRLLDPAFTGPGVFWGQKVMERVAGLLDGARIEQLPIPFTAVATDLTHGREVWFQRGSVATAMRASIGIPSVFTPVVVGGRLLADGGLLNPVPVDALLGADADLTVAVSLSGRRSGEAGSSRPLTAPAETEGILGELGDWVRHELFESDAVRGVLESSAVRGVREWWLERFGTDTGPADGAVGQLAAEPVTPDTETAPRDFDFGELPRGLRTTDVVSLSLEVAESLITRFRMAASPPDVFVEFAQDVGSTFDFHRAGELIALGRAKAAEVFDAAGL
ncbi:MAG: patatin-like phospholipase family protein [Propioniciclava sp.]|uniref:patatin-like phospholipase family protein n=1 Tax=Propioniciclava sp. TaxID=2038686 RepID=UPI0039E71D8C